MLGAVGAAPNARLCAHCRFRSRRLILESLRVRHRHTSSTQRFVSGPGGSIFFRRNGKDFAGSRSVKPEFDKIWKSRLEAQRRSLKDSPLVSALLGPGSTDKGSNGFDTLWKHVLRTLGVGDSGSSGRSARQTPRLEALRRQWKETASDSWKRFTKNVLDPHITSTFHKALSAARFTESELKRQRAVADLRYPTEWYPATRARRRKIYLHVGPTNSGKTYHALKRLEQAKKGVYAGPLRLLAHEVYSRMNAKNISCALITGEERREPTATGDGSQSVFSCTVEMMSANAKFDVAVIDEIQMLGDAERGWAWTSALLATRADEIHLCGEARMVPLITELCASLGEEVTVHHYKRLSPLSLEPRSLGGDLSRLRKGDCVVSFSVMSIHAMRRAIEDRTGKKVAIVYGSLPPETRAQQARLFNDPDNDYDYLVASDAIGMGLNLAIKRVIFESAAKYDGTVFRPLEVADIKQIAGRAGRYRTAQQIGQEAAPRQDLAAAKGEARPAVDGNMGFVTTLEDFDYPLVAEAMSQEPEPLGTAGMYPHTVMLEAFANYFPPRTPFSFILTRLHELSRVHRRFHLCGLKNQVEVADVIEPIEGLTIANRNIICAMPCSVNDMEVWEKVLPAFAQMIADARACSLVDIDEVPLEVMDRPPSVERTYLRDLERLHKVIIGFLWLGYRFPGVFIARSVAMHAKELVEARIEDVLQNFSFSEEKRRKLTAKRELQMKKEAEMLRATAAAADTATAVSQGEQGTEAVGQEREDDMPDKAPTFQGSTEALNLGLDELELDDGPEKEDADVYAKAKEAPLDAEELGIDESLTELDDELPSDPSTTVSPEKPMTFPPSDNDATRTNDADESHGMEKSRSQASGTG